MIDGVHLEKLAMAGLEAAVIPSPHMFKGLFSADSVISEGNVQEPANDACEEARLGD